jgi:hypothetical protein
MKNELAGAALAMLACASGPSGSEGTGAEQPFESVVSELHSGIAEKRREVVRDQESWARLWSEIHRGQGSARVRRAASR